jgi:CRISP-associated protein Cas1
LVIRVPRDGVQLIAEGYDPTIGILHGRESERGTYPAFALDRMEPVRPVVDRAVLHLISSNAFTGADFSIQPDGVCR